METNPLQSVFLYHKIDIHCENSVPCPVFGSTSGRIGQPRGGGDSGGVASGLGEKRLSSTNGPEEVPSLW